MLVVKHIKALKAQYPAYLKAREKSGKKGKVLHLWNFPSIQVVFIGLLCTCLGSTILGILKINGGEGSSFAYDWFGTIWYLIAGCGTLTGQTLRTFKLFSFKL